MRQLAASIAASVALHATAAAWLEPAPAAKEQRTARPAPLTAALVAEPPSSARATQHRAEPRRTKFASVPAAPIYYKSAEVDVRARPLEMKPRGRTADNYPLGRLAIVKLRLFISEEGAVDAYEILEADGLPKAAGLDDIREIRFRPAERGGRAVKSQKVVEFSFVP